jgi:hypothetical protein
VVFDDALTKSGGRDVCRHADMPTKTTSFEQAAGAGARGSQKIKIFQFAPKNSFGAKNKDSNTKYLRDIKKKLVAHVFQSYAWR